MKRISRFHYAFALILIALALFLFRMHKLADTKQRPPQTASESEQMQIGDPQSVVIQVEKENGEGADIELKPVEMKYETLPSRKERVPTPVLTVQSLNRPEIIITGGSVADSAEKKEGMKNDQ